MRTETQGLFCAHNAIVAYFQVLRSVSVVYVGGQDGKNMGFAVMFPCVIDYFVV